jgi:hypothetical protein
MLDVPEFHRHILYGALCGGPGADDSYNDDITDYTRNEVTDDYNAGFVGALAKMYSMYGGEPLANWPQPDDFHPPEGVLNEYFVRGFIQWEGPRDCDVLFQVNNRSACPPTVRDGLSARYFLDLSEVFDAGYSVSDVNVQIQSGDEGASLNGLTQWDGDVYYFELDWTGTLIHPGHWDICEKEAIVRITHPIDNATSNDWSYQELTGNPDYDCKTFLGMTAYIPIYDNGVLLWGEEPPGGSTQTPTPTPDPGTPTPDPGGDLGDVNSDGTVDIIDALLVAQYYVGLDPSGFNPDAADTNCDGSIDIIDALLIAQYYVGLVSAFC